MTPRRRRVLQVAAASLSGTASAGCLAGPEPGGEGTPDGERTPREPAELPRVDEPPYDIEEPECGAGGGRDPLWLCANMAAEPSLAFEQAETPTTVFADEGLTLDHGEPAGPQFYAALLTGEEDLDRVRDDVSGAPADVIEGTAFDDEVVVAAQTGWGSGTVTPHLKRVEETTEGLHAFGCYRRPCGGTADVSVRTVVARVERPARLEAATVSLTYDAAHRVTVAVGEGVVTVAEDLESGRR